MKKSFALIFLLIAAAFAAITWLRQPAGDAERSAAGSENLDRRQIQEFWAAYHEATRLRVEGAFEEAATLYEKTLAINPDHEESLYYLGNCHFELGDYDQARRLYEELLQRNPSSQRALSQLGITLSSPLPGAEPDWDRAEEAFRKSIDVNREESGPFLRLGYLELQRDRPQAAFEHFLTAAGFRSPEGIFMAGLVRFRQGDFREASDFFHKVLEVRAHENKISGRGVTSEGDVDAESVKLTPLEAAAVKAETFLAWLPAPYREASDDFLRRAAEKESRVRPCPIQPGDRRWSDLGRVAAADWDGDGDLDLAAVDPRQGLLLLRRSDGGLQRADVPGLAVGPGLSDVIWGDYDGDGDPDLYAIGSGRTGRVENHLLRNECSQSAPCRFLDVTAESGLAGTRNTIRARFVDYDGDNRPDLVEVGADDPPLRLFRNLGNGRFRESSSEAGVAFEGGAVDLAPADFNGDDMVDLFVLRWRRPGLLLLNRGQGRFGEAQEEFAIAGVGGGAFSALAFDYDGDGRDDLLVASRASWERSLQAVLHPALHTEKSSPRLFRNVDGKVFEEVTEAVGLNHPYGVTQAVPLDFDRDGWTDLLLANGGLEAFRLEPSVLLRNEQGRSFSEYARLPALDSPANPSSAATLDWEDSAAPKILLAGAGCYQPKAPPRSR